MFVLFRIIFSIYNKRYRWHLNLKHVIWNMTAFKLWNSCKSSIKTIHIGILIRSLQIGPVYKTMKLCINHWAFRGLPASLSNLWLWGLKLKEKSNLWIRRKRSVSNYLNLKSFLIDYTVRYLILIFGRRSLFICFCFCFQNINVL